MVSHFAQWTWSHTAGPIKVADSVRMYTPNPESKHDEERLARIFAYGIGHVSFQRIRKWVIVRFMILEGEEVN